MAQSLVPSIVCPISSLKKTTATSLACKIGLSLGRKSHRSKWPTCRSTNGQSSIRVNFRATVPNLVCSKRLDLSFTAGFWKSVWISFERPVHRWIVFAGESAKQLVDLTNDSEPDDKTQNRPFAVQTEVWL